MRKYEELCKAYTDSRNNYFSVQDEVMRFSTILFNEFRNFMGLIPEENNIFQCVPSEINEITNKTYTIAGAVKYQSSGVWSFSILLKLHIDGNLHIHPAQLIKITIWIKFIKNIIYFRFDEAYEFHSSSKDSFVEYLHQKFFPQIVDSIIRAYHSGASSLISEFIDEGNEALAIRIVNKFES